MDPLLFVFTMSDDSRESASVYYSSYLLVYGDESDRPKISKSLAELLDGARVTPSGSVAYPYAGENMDYDNLIVGLALEGWQARWLKSSMVIEEG